MIQNLLMKDLNRTPAVGQSPASVCVRTSEPNICHCWDEYSRKNAFRWLDSADL